jgi:hypothetical protein
MHKPRQTRGIIARGAAERFFHLPRSEQSIRLMGKTRKIVLSNDTGADRILPFAAVLLPAKEAMLY